MTLIKNIKEEASRNKAFLHTLIGTILMLTFAIILYVAVLIQIVKFKLVKKLFIPLAIFPVVVVYVIVSLLYTNYCLVHGSCNKLASFQGTSSLILGIVVALYACYFIFHIYVNKSVFTYPNI